MRFLISSFCIGWTLIFSVSCKTDALPHDVETALAMSGDSSLRNLLLDYRQNDEERFKAACFLVAHAGWHYYLGGETCYDERIDSIIKRTDSLCLQSFNTHCVNNMDTLCLQRWLNDTLKHRAFQLRDLKVASASRYTKVSDIETIDSAFVSKQVEHAFALRERYESVRQLSDTDFYEFILAYRGIDDYPFLYTNEELAKHFFPVLNSANEDAYTAANLYNHYLKWVNSVNGEYPLPYSTGMPELLYRNKRNCVDKVHFATLALRSCGYPIAIDFNMAYRAAPFRHYMCALRSETGEFLPFNAEKGIPENDDSRFVACLNIYRSTFACQRNTPYFLRGEHEFLPIEFYSPCIKDVTDEYMDVVSLKYALKNKSTANKLAYLATINTHGLLTPVTWGCIEGDEVLFEKVVTEQIYFPIIYSQWGKLIPIGKPFVLRDGKTDIELLNHPNGRFIDAELKRKYPRKPHLVACAQSAVGTTVLGSNHPDFSNADTLGIIQKCPDTYWEELPLGGMKKYKYYRVESSKQAQTLPLSEILFGKLGKTNEFIPLHDITSAENEITDNNVQTTSDKAYIDFCAHGEQTPTHLRYMIKHADNTIVPGHQYRLYEWDDEQGWKVVWDRKSEGYSICAEHLEIGRLYWLSDTTTGVEEMPFVVNEDGTIEFTHSWILENIYAKGKHK